MSTFSSRRLRRAFHLRAARSPQASRAAPGAPPGRPHRSTILAAIVVVALVVCSFAAVAAAQSSSPSPAPTGKVTLKIGWMGEVDNMNPFIGWTNNVYDVYSNEYLLLVERTQKELTAGPNGVAKSWEVSEDGLTWTFHLNEGITWHDGQPLTAEDVAFTFNYIVDNEMQAFATYCQGIEKAVVVDPYTVQIICSKPKANMLQLWIPMLPKHIWEKIPPKAAGTTFANDPPIVGNGPWQVTEWKKGRYLRMTANKDFWMGPPKIDEYLYVVYTNPDTMVKDLQSGNLDVAYLFPPAQWETLKNTPGVEAIEYNWFNWDYIGFNCYEGKSKGHPALRDKNFRAALEYAIDRDQLIQVARSGHAWPGWSFMPPKNWSDPDYHWEPAEGQRRDFDLEKAKQLLDEAGYTDTNGDGVREYKGKPISLRLWAETSSPEGQRETKLIAGWWDEVGIKVKLEVLDEGVYFDKIWAYDGDTFAPDFDVYHWEWDGYFDPGLTLDCFTTGQIEGWNEFAWSNAEFDELDIKQNEAIDPAQRAEYIWRMQEVMYEDAACVVLNYPLKLEAYRVDKWQGWDRARNGTGPAAVNASNPWAYYKVEPRVATAEEEGGSNTTWVIIGVIAAIVVVAVVVLLLRRRKPALEE